MLLVAVVAAGLLCAVLVRRWTPVHDRLSVAATTILAVLGAVMAAVALGAVVSDGSTRAWWEWLSVPAGAVVSLLLVASGAWVNAHVLDALRRRRDRTGPGVVDRLEAWAESRPAGARGGPTAVVLRSWRRAIDVRVTGLAAEMTYYGLISLVPLVTALGASLGFLRRVVGPAQVAQIEQVLIDAVTQVFAAQVAEDVVAPLVAGLLREERAGFAIGSVVIALWLASRMFRAAVRALDDAYRVPERRNLLGQYVLGLALALGAVLTLVVLLTLVVVGPLLGDGQEIAARFGLGTFFEVAWSLARWPALAMITGGYLTLLYRYGPNVRTTWTTCLPGAALGTVGLVVVALGFSLYVGIVGLSTPGTDEAATAAVTGAAQAIGMVLAGVVWLWLSSIVILLGGVLNAELDTSAHLPADRGSELDLESDYQPVAPGG